MNQRELSRQFSQRLRQTDSDRCSVASYCGTREGERERVSFSRGDEIAIDFPVLHDIAQVNEAREDCD